MLSPTRSITLNAIELTISEALIRQQTGNSTRADVTYDASSETATLDLPTEVETGPATIVLSFTGILNDRLRGFYLSTYTDAGGRERDLASTQFEATDARRAFPCWDEPAIKATFSVTLVVPEELAAISNMPEETASVANGLRTVRFRATPADVDVPAGIRGGGSALRRGAL